MNKSNFTLLILASFFIFNTVQAKDEESLSISECLEILKGTNKTDSTSQICKSQAAPKKKFLDIRNSVCDKKKISSAKKNKKVLSEGDVSVVAQKVNSLKKVLSETINQASTSDLIKKEMNTRLEKLSLTATICLPTTVHYDMQSNTLTGCIPPGVTDEQLTYLLGHELSHSIDPCSYHFGESSKGSFGFGRKALSYSEPQNFEKSLSEYPFKKMISCMPADVREMTLMNKVDSKDWNVFCSRVHLNEFFADQMGLVLFNQIFSKRSSADEKNILATFPELLCPSKGDSYVSETKNGVVTMIKTVGWMDSLTHPDFDIRYSLVFSQLSSDGQIDKDAKVGKYDFSSCFK